MKYKNKKVYASFQMEVEENPGDVEAVEDLCKNSSAIVLDEPWCDPVDFIVKLVEDRLDTTVSCVSGHNTLDISTQYGVVIKTDIYPGKEKGKCMKNICRDKIQSRDFDNANKFEKLADNYSHAIIKLTSSSEFNTERSVKDRVVKVEKACPGYDQRRTIRCTDDLKDIDVSNGKDETTFYSSDRIRYGWIADNQEIPTGTYLKNNYAASVI